MSASIEQRLRKIENKLFSKSKNIPGTSITRVLKPISGWYWCLAIGQLQMRKEFFYADKITDAITQAEKYYNLKDE